MITIDGKPIHRAELHAPLYRERWELEIAYSDSVAPSGKVTVQWGSATFVGTVDPAHTGEKFGEAIAKIVGGWGWSTELPATWYQSDSPGVGGRFVATKAAEAVGETLRAATGDDPPATSLFRPLRVSYSRARSTAGAVLEDTLAPGVSWWVDFDGTTRVGVRVAPSPAARVVLLDYDPASKWAELDADDPTGLLGATIPADPIRGIPALVITELYAWSGGEEGLRFRAAVAPAAAPTRGRLAEALEGVVRGLLPELPALELRRARVIAQGSDGRVSVQQVDRSGQVADFGRTEGAVWLYAGSPGVSAELDITSSPETVLAFSRADWSDPFALLAAPKGQAGHVPVKVLHEASTEIRLVGNSAGKVKVGAAPTVPVALAPDLAETFVLVNSALAGIVAYATAVGVAVPAAAPAAATLSTLITTPVTGLAAQITVKQSEYTATKLEAK